LALPWNYDGERWAGAPDGIEQVGCIHTSQGLEFDWIGVLIGDDLQCKDGKIICDPAKRAGTDQSLKGWKGEFADANGDSAKQKVILDKVDSIIKSTYRVLLSRGRKGCYVWCRDIGLREYLKERLKLAKSQEAIGEEQKVINLIPDDDPRVKKAAFKTLLPVYSLKAAAGYFGNGVAVEKEGWAEVSGKLDAKMFVARVNGKSMEPNIPDGTYCVFRANPEGTREGKIVLAQYQGPADPETGGSFTVKFYHSEKKQEEDGTWRHQTIVLRPANKAFKPIELAAGNPESFKIVAEFVKKSMAED
jgi:uncharacterized protein